MNGLSTAHWLIPGKAACRLAVTEMLAFGRVAAQAVGTLMRAGRADLVQATTATRLALVRATARSHAALFRFGAALIVHRHGTWLVLFAILFTGLWLLVGWIGMGNGLPRGVLVGIATPLVVNALFPLKPSSR